MKENTILKLFSAMVTLMFGMFILFGSFDWNSRQFFIYGMILAFAGVIMAGVPLVAWRWKLGLIFIGLYFIGRGTGFIEHQVLRFGLGIPLFLFGIWSIWVILTRPERSKN